jgi:hypothetical protein
VFARELGRGFTVVDLLAVLTLVALVVGVLLVLRPVNHFGSANVECMNNVKNLVGLLESVDGDYPRFSGPNLILYFVVQGWLESEDELALLFCPGDVREHLDPTAYRDLDLTEGGHGHLTSYAARDQIDQACRAAREGNEVVLVCDDSADHHGNGYVVGLTGGAARWREHADDWAPGPDSEIEELRCVRAN